MSVHPDVFVPVLKICLGVMQTVDLNWLNGVLLLLLLLLHILAATVASLRLLLAAAALP